MTREMIEKKTFTHFQSGYCCAESVLKSISEHFSNPPEDIAKAASAFCGGFGGTEKEFCGAFTGGLIAIGWLFGRTQPGQDSRITKELTGTYKKAFENRFGSINCAKLLDCFGEQDDYDQCKKMTADAAGILFELVQPFM